MLQEDRFVRIQSLLASIDRLSTERLIQDMQVSRETVRQDLLALESMGLVRRVHGGVARVTRDEPPFVQRQALRVAEKRAIAKAAVKRLQPGQMVFIDAGTTTAILAEELSLISRLVVVTNSITVALKLAGTQATAGSANSMRVVLLGGDTNPEIPCTYGEVTLNEIRRYRADVTLLSPVGISAEDGVTFGNEHEASLATAMAQQSSSLVVLADYSKIGLRSRYAVACPPSQQTLITNAHAANTEALEALNAQGVAVIPV
ncbi:DeoR/GlpR family DNA-binding transcription regulator [Comamonas sp. JUb58]|uniref:DeoR/GlpR family DNA-binding transcription regulator n=1 Tax=Comamonas sp. JUb58 TaxID=2485114 RepID=UPI0010613BB1|nr:DeoR/GlpR family DNA-binding transcription regulator [Comamonas sp. JUb58]TDS83967.1 DeoR family transcriptional regulator [Comamonas sp. JUb58]